MKREGNLFNDICSLDNLRTAESIARKGKEDQYGVYLFDRDPEGNLLELRDMLMYKEFTTSQYNVFKIYDPKERDVYGLPYYPDRIVHHAAMLKLESRFMSVFTADSYSSIKGKGIGGFDKAMKAALRDVPNTQYCLKIDIEKFYPNIDHDILKGQLRRIFKDPDLFWLLDDIIDSAPGVPIGNYLSQFFANFNLTPFDHWLKEEMRVRRYFRYADDIVILAPNKIYLHELLARMRDYLLNKLKLIVKGNYQVFPVEAQGIDVCGFVYFHDYSLMRKSIKQGLARAVAGGKSWETIAGYLGWAGQCNSNHLVKKLFPGRVAV